MWFSQKATNSKGHKVYADAAASTPISSAAKAELVRLLDVYGNPGGLHTEALEAKAELERARASVASSIGAHADEIFFTASGTEANNLAITGLLRPLLKKFGTVHAVTSAIEHASILEPLFALEKEGLLLTILQVDHEGLISLKEVTEAITEHTALVSIQFINSEVGTVEPIREIAKEIRKSKALRAPEKVTSFPLYFHTDASQAPLWIDLKVEKLGVDLLTIDAQKMLGPKGVGALFIKRGSDVDPQILGGGQESGMRSGTANTPLVGSFAVALADAQKSVEEHALHTREVRDYCWSEIKRLLPDTIINGPGFENRAPNNLNVSIPGLDAQMAVIALNTHGISASTRSACDVGGDEPSHVIQALGIPRELAGTAIRFTLLPDVSKQQAVAIAEALVKVADLYRNAIAIPKNVV